MLEVKTKKTNELVKKIVVVVERTKTGYCAYSKKYPVCTTGSTISDLKENMTEALKFYFKETPVNRSIKFKKEMIYYEYDMREFFKIYKILNAKEFAVKIRMNSTLLSQYVNGKKNPSEEQTFRIYNGILQVSKELGEIKAVLR